MWNKCTGGLNAHSWAWSEKKKNSLSESINKTCWLVFFPLLSSTTGLCTCCLWKWGTTKRKEKKGECEPNVFPPYYIINCWNSKQGMNFHWILQTEQIKKSWNQSLLCCKCVGVTTSIPFLHERLFKSDNVSVVRAVYGFSHQPYRGEICGVATLPRTIALLFALISQGSIFLSSDDSKSQ